MFFLCYHFVFDWIMNRLFDVAEYYFFKRQKNGTICILIHNG